MSHHLPPAVDHKEDLNRLAKSKDFVNHIIPKCAVLEQIALMRGKRYRYMQRIPACGAYQSILVQTCCPKFNSYQDKDSNITYRLVNNATAGLEYQSRTEKMIRRLSTLLTRIMERNDKVIACDSLDLPGYPRTAANTATQTYKEP